jgi:hypothetical protein
MNVADRFAWVRAVIAAEPRPTLAEIAVAVVLAEHFNATRGAAWPAQRSMAGLLRMDRRTVRRALGCLERRGFIECTNTGGPHRSAGWCLALPPEVTLRASYGARTENAEGAVKRPLRAPHSAQAGRPAAPLKGAPQRPEQVSRSEHVGKPYSAAQRASAGAVRARGAEPKKPSTKRRHSTAPARL